MNAMQDDKLVILFLGILVGLVSLGVVVWLFATKRFARLSRPLVIIAVLPNLILTTLIASLAIHMHSSLGEWPQQIGDEGFPTPLIIHADITIGCFIFLLFANVFLLPVAIVICATIRALRTALYYLALYYFTYCCSLVMLQMMPDGFLYWWWD